MLRGNDLLGVMYADSSTGAGNFDRIDLEILGLLAEQAAAAIETGRLVADLQRSYSDLKAAQERLIRGERLRVMGEMTSGVAHEFNNLLTAILARLQLLNLGYLAPEVRSHLALIEKAALDAAGVIRRLQSFSKDRRQQDYSLVDMSEVCGDVVELLRPLWSSRRRLGKRPISVHLRVDRGLTILGDATELREVLTNLLKNSLEALDGGGAITVSASRSGGQVHIEVADDGPGIPNELLGRVFDPFFTTKGERGTGLGLCLALQIVERHGGEIRLESTVGSGTVAIVDLPYADREVQDSGRSAGTRPSSRVRVLVVDDDPEVLSPLCAYLEGSGHTVVGANSGVAAMEKIADSNPDFVISDIGMPEMDGMEFCRRVHALRPHLPVVLMSGTASAIEPALVRAVGASALLAKPFTMRQVLDLLTALATQPGQPN
jgi:signal transduction histidine kinase/CheY-like chemotaxis protein